MGGTGSAGQFKQLGALDPIKPVLVLPEVTDLANWLDARHHFSDKEEQYNLVFVSLAKEIVAFDPRQVKPEDVDDLNELLDPKWRGRIAINDPTASAGSGRTTAIWLWSVMGPEKAAEFLRAIRGQAGAVARDERQLIEWIARGRYPVLLAPNDTVLQGLAQEGVNVGRVTEMKDYGTYTTASSGSLALINNSPQPNAAKVFINWALTREGQMAYSQALNQPTRRLELSTDHLTAVSLPRPGGKYWPADNEENRAVPPELASLLRDVFDR
jgi:iron(III) transport system substrate-binding protein